jgi:hypothetical protein
VTRSQTGLVINAIMEAGFGAQKRVRQIDYFGKYNSISLNMLWLQHQGLHCLHFFETIESLQSDSPWFAPCTWAKFRGCRSLRCRALCSSKAKQRTSMRPVRGVAGSDILWQTVWKTVWQTAWMVWDLQIHVNSLCWGSSESKRARSKTQMSKRW